MVPGVATGSAGAASGVETVAVVAATGVAAIVPICASAGDTRLVAANRNIVAGTRPNAKRLINSFSLSCGQGSAHATLAPLGCSGFALVRLALGPAFEFGQSLALFLLSVT